MTPVLLYADEHPVGDAIMWILGIISILFLILLACATILEHRDAKSLTEQYEARREEYKHKHWVPGEPQPEPFKGSGSTFGKFSYIWFNDQKIYLRFFEKRDQYKQYVDYELHVFMKRNPEHQHIRDKAMECNIHGASVHEGREFGHLSAPTEKGEYIVRFCVGKDQRGAYIWEEERYTVPPDCFVDSIVPDYHNMYILDKQKGTKGEALVNQYRKDDTFSDPVKNNQFMKVLIVWIILCFLSVFLKGSALAGIVVSTIACGIWLLIVSIMY